MMIVLGITAVFMAAIALLSYRFSLANWYADLGAVTILEIAHSGFIHQHGVSKSLGYTYVWQGDLDKATELLLNIPEATDEMQVYIWWWET